VPVVDCVRIEDELFAHQIEQRRQRVDRGRDEVALDAGNRRLRRACPRGELGLRQAVPPAHAAEELSRRHHGSISDLMYSVRRKNAGSMIDVQPLTDKDRAWAGRLEADSWSQPVVARLGESELELRLQ